MTSIRDARTIAVSLVVAGCGASAPHDAAGGHERASDAGQGHGDGHRHDHRFDDPEVWAARFEDPGRDEWQRPDVVIEALALSPESRVADIGAATGYFPVRLARVATSGRVWGVDIEPALVRYLNARARREGLDNLFAILGTPDDPLLPEPVDGILVVNTYHHIEDRTAYFQRLSRLLSDGGRLVVVDHKMGELPHGPPESMRILPEQVRAELEAAGYRLRRADTTSLPYQYLLVFTLESRVTSMTDPVTP